MVKTIIGDTFFTIDSTLNEAYEQMLTKNPSFVKFTTRLAPELKSGQPHTVMWPKKPDYSNPIVAILNE